MLPAAPLDRPDPNTTLMALVGHVYAEPDAVYGALAHALRPTTDAVVHFTADEPSRTVVVQGRWWYRAEWRVVQADPDELSPDDEVEPGAAAVSRIEHEIVNVAPRIHWLGGLAGGRVVRAAPARFQELLSDLVARVE